MMNISITRNRFAAMIQRIKSSQVFKIELKNKFQSERNSNFESRFKKIKQRDCQNDTMQNRSN